MESLNQLGPSATLGAITHFRSQLANTFLAYFRLWDFFTNRIDRLLGAQVHSLSDENEFWWKVTASRISLSELRENQAEDASRKKPTPFVCGDQVKLLGWYLSDWIPRLPGALWKEEFLANRHGRGIYDFPLEGRIDPKVKSFVDAYRSVHPSGVAMAAGLPIYDYFGKNRMCLTGVGSVRFPTPLGQQDEFACLSAVTAGSWDVDRGVPIVVSEQVYREFDRARRQTPHSAVEVDLIGRVVIGELPTDFYELLRTPVGLELPNNLDHILRRANSTPQAYIHVTSPLDCSFRANDTHPECAAWTLYEAHFPDEPASQSFEFRQMLRGLGCFGLTFFRFNPTQKGSLDNAVEFLHNSPKWLRVTRDQPWSTWLGGGDTALEARFSLLAEKWSQCEVSLLTDFDGVSPRLHDATFNLLSNPSQQAPLPLLREQIKVAASEWENALLLRSNVNLAANLIYNWLDEFGEVRCLKCKAIVASKTMRNRCSTAEYAYELALLAEKENWLISPAGITCNRCSHQKAASAQQKKSDPLADERTILARWACNAVGSGVYGGHIDGGNARCERCSQLLKLARTKGDNSWRDTSPANWSVRVARQLRKAGWIITDSGFLCKKCKNL